MWPFASVWSRLHALLLAKLRGVDRIDFSRVVVDSASVRAVFGGQKTGANPTDRRKNGSKHHDAVDAGGVPLATTLTGANRHDVTQLIPLINAIPPIAGKRGAPLRKPRCVLGDRAYDSNPHRMILSGRAIATRIARRNTEHGSGLGVYRYVVEQTGALFHQFRRLRVRYDRRADIHEAFMTLACCAICWRRLNQGIF